MNMKSKYTLVLLLAAVAIGLAPQSFAADGTFDHVIATVGVTTPNLTFDNGTSDGGDMGFLSNGNDTWFLDNRNGTMRFFRSGDVLATITPSGFNIDGNLAGKDIIINNGAADGGNMRFVSSGGTDHFIDNLSGSMRFFSQATGVNMTINGSGDTSFAGQVTVEVLVITGGADLSEQFDIAGAGGSQVEPGSVVSIDAVNPGALILSAKAYDRTVAGIVSGAGGLKPGMQMGQTGSIAAGKYPVALTGRVYCKADASLGAIVPGDLLTTSAVPGHAMKVVDHGAATGAIIGKAMTGLAQGEQGLVLVLVSLQ